MKIQRHLGILETERAIAILDDTIEKIKSLDRYSRPNISTLNLVLHIIFCLML